MPEIKKKLGDIFEIKAGGTPLRSRADYYGGDIAWVKISDMLQGKITRTDESITKMGLENSGAKLLPKGTLLISIFATIGRTAELAIDATTNQAIVGLIPKTNGFDKQFIRFYLDSQVKKLLEMSRGVAQNNINKSILSDIEVPLPNLKIQQKIVSILEQADNARQKRNQANQLTEKFLQSAFLEMFGDPMTNDKGWDLVLFSEVGSLDRGKSKHRPRNAPFLLGGKYPLIQTGDVSNCGGYIREYTQTYSEEGLRQSKMWRKGTLAITIAANIAKTGILTFDACFPDSMVGFIPNEKTSVVYIQYWLSFLQKMLEDNAPESAQKNINLEILRNLNVPLPPLTLQKKFVLLVERVEKLREKQRESERELENLFQSLMQRYFG